MLLICTALIWFLLVYRGPNWSLLVYIVSYYLLFTSVYWFSWFCVVCAESGWSLLVYTGAECSCMVCNGFCKRFALLSLEMISTGFHWFLVDHTGLYWVLLILNGL